MPSDRLKLSRQLWFLAWPLIISRSCQAVIGFTDALFAGRLGEVELAAVTTGALNTYAVFIFPIGTVGILASFVSQYFGRGEARTCRRYGWYGLIIAVFSQAGAAILILSLPKIFSLLNMPRPVENMMVSYMAIRLWSTGFVALQEALSNYYCGMGITRLPMYANMLTMIINVPFAWVLMFGGWGLPAMGTDGAAWASLLATMCSSLLLFAYFARGSKTDVDPASSSAQAVQPESSPKPGGRRVWLSELAAVLRYGLPNGLNWFLEFAAFLFFINVVVSGLGTTSLAAMNAVFQINGLAFMPTFGLASAGAILAGQVIGASRPDRVAGIVKLTFLWSAVWMAAVAAVYLLLPRQIFALFVIKGQDAGLLQSGALVLMLSAGWQIFDALGMTLSEALRAAGDTLFCLYARVVLGWLFFAPLSYLWVFVGGGGLAEATFSIILYLGALAAALLWRFLRGNWKEIRLTESLQPG